MSNMRHKQKTLVKWLKPEKVFLRREVIDRLKEYDLYAQENFKRYS